MNFAPYALAEDGGGRRGLFVDINAAIAARAGIDIVDSVVPIARVMKNLQRGVSDCSVFLLSPWSGANFLAVAEVVDRFDSVIVTRKDLSIARAEICMASFWHCRAGATKNFLSRPTRTSGAIPRMATSKARSCLRLAGSTRSPVPHSVFIITFRS